MKQQYDRYRVEDWQTWRALYDNLVEPLTRHAAQAYLRGMLSCNFSRGRIPVLEELDRILLSATGWQTTVVEEDLTPDRFFGFLAQQHFPVRSHLRKPELLDNQAEKDFFYGLLGHVPLLSNPDYSRFVTGLAKLALEHITNPAAMELIGRLYWYSVEQGITVEKGQLKMYGAALLTSRAASHFALHGHRPGRLPFNCRSVLQTACGSALLQEKYFFIEGFRELPDHLEELAACLPPPASRQINNPLNPD